MSGEGAVSAAATGLISTLIALAIVLALAYVAIRLLRRWQERSPGGAGRNAAEGSIRFVRALAVGNRERVMIIEVDGERMLIGVAAGGVSLLTRLASLPPAPTADAPSGTDPAGR